jgi:hypothetical protein
LANEFSTDAAAANAKYKDKDVVLSGTVVGKRTNDLGAATIEVKGNGKLKVFCEFTAQDEDKAATRPVQAGQQVKLKGHFLYTNQGSDGTVTLSICTMLK